MKFFLIIRKCFFRIKVLNSLLRCANLIYGILEALAKHYLFDRRVKKLSKG